MADVGEARLRAVDQLEPVENEEGAGADVVDIRTGTQEGFWKVEMGEYLAIVQSALERAMTPAQEKKRWAVVKDMPQTD